MRIKELDALRGIAALAVVLYHFTTRYNQIFNKEFSVNFSFGWLGVPVFFILSGFVIYLTINKCKNVKDFLKKRFFRLYPTYWICLFFTLIVQNISSFSVNNLTLSDVLINFTMFQELFNVNNLDGAYWSLFPELIFYLIMATLMLFKKQNTFYFYNVILILLGIIYLTWPVMVFEKLITIHYILLFMIGIAFYRIYNKINTSVDFILIFFNWLIGTKLYYYSNQSISLFLLYCFFLIIIGVYFLFIYGKLKFLANSKVLMFLGYISYTLYLIHQNIGYVIINFTENHIGRFFSVLLAMFIVLILATIITFKIEPFFRNLIVFKNDENEK